MSTIADIVARLQKVPEAVEASRLAIANELRSIIAENVAAQRGPDGTPWQRSADRTVSIVLRNAMKNVDVRAVGTAVVATVRGPEARHHLGIARGRVKREIIPTRKIPQPMVEAIERVVKRAIGGVK